MTIMPGMGGTEIVDPLQPTEKERIAALESEVKSLREQNQALEERVRELQSQLMEKVQKLPPDQDR